MRGKAYPPLVETQAVHDVFVSGVARVDAVGAGIFRLTFFTESHCSFDGRKERNIVARFIVSAETIATNREVIAKEIAKFSMQAANDG